MDYKPVGVCSQLIRVDVENDIVKHAEFIGWLFFRLFLSFNIIKGISITILRRPSSFHIINLTTLL